MKDTTIKKALEWLKENEDEFTQLVEELDSYNGFLYDDRYYEMEFLEEFYDGKDIMNLLQRAYYGEDEDSGENSSFCPNRNYFRYNAYGNLVSSDYKDYSDHLDEYFIEQLENNINNIDIPSDLLEIMKEENE